MEIRGYIIAYFKRLAKSKRDSEKILLAELSNLMAQTENYRNNSQLRLIAVPFLIIESIQRGETGARGKNEKSL